MSDQEQSVLDWGRPLADGEKYFSDRWPEVVYKYRSFEKAKEILSTRTIYFARPQQFDDPHDTALPIRFDKLDKQAWSEYLSFLFDELMGSSLGNKLPIFNYMQKTEIACSAHLGPIFLLRTLRKYVKVFCMSKINNNDLLWSLYGDCHRGICLGFNSHHLGANTSSLIGIVRYSQDYPDIIPSDPQRFEQDLISSVLKKSESWRYQEEYRMINFFPNQKFGILPDAISELIFGLKTSEKEIDEIRDLINNSLGLKHIKLYRIKALAQSFNFETVPLN